MPRSSWTAQNKLDGDFKVFVFVPHFVSFRHFLVLFVFCLFTFISIFVFVYLFLLCLIFFKNREKKKHEAGYVGLWGGSEEN